VRGFTTGNPRQILFGWWSEEGWDGRGMWHVWQRRKCMYHSD
jgi:hypothetical protein